MSSNGDYDYSEYTSHDYFTTAAPRTRVTVTQTIKYNLRKQVTSSQSLKYALRKFVQSSNTLKYRIFALSISSSKLKYNILVSASRFNTLRYSIVQQQKRKQTLKYNIGRLTKHRATLLYEIYPVWWLMPRFDRVIENFIRNNYADDISIINPPQSQISWGKVWGEMGATRRTVLKCIQLPTKLTQLDPPQRVRLETSPVQVRITNRDQENSKAPLLQNMENYILNMLWNNINSDQIKAEGINSMLPISYNYVDIDLGLFELNIIVNCYYFRKVPTPPGP